MRNWLICIVILFAYTPLSAQTFWHTTFEFPGGPKVDIASVGDSTLFVACPQSILRSTNLGNSWDTVLASLSNFSIFVTTSNTVFVGGSGKLYHSDDIGETWDSIHLNSTFPVTQFLEYSHNELFAITGVLDIQQGFVGAGVYYSSNGGADWIQRNDGLGSFLCCQHLAKDRNGTLYLACADEFVSGNGGLFVSEDTGLSWQHIDIFVDGRGVIENRINVESTTCLEVTPQDSLFFSFSGVSREGGGSGAAVNLNLIKSIDEVDANSFWLPRKVSNTSSWWLDRRLNNMHFSQSGDWFSSASGSINTGGTYFSHSNGALWEKNDDGLGVDIFGLRNIQRFAEMPGGVIFMVQTLDERVYWTDTSAIALINKQAVRDEVFGLFPNPVRRGGQVTIHSARPVTEVVVLDLLGRELSQVFVQDNIMEIKAPIIPGLYFVLERSTGNRTHLIVH